jgi:ATP-dependent RNA circularization protein (DNA/RNA ligase family)
MQYRFWRSKRKVKNDLQGFLYLIRSDKREHKPEVNKILSIAEKYGLDSSELTESGTIPDSDLINFPSNNEERFDCLYYLITLLLHDEPYHNEEFDFCMEMASIIGFERTSSPTIIREIYNGIKIKMKEEEIKEKVRNIGNKASLDFNSGQ